MRTVRLSLGLALLCLLRAEAENLGAAGLDTSKVICDIPGKGRWERGLRSPGWGLERCFGTGDSRGQQGTPQPPLALLSHPDEGSHPAPA